MIWVTRNGAANTFFITFTHWWCRLHSSSLCLAIAISRFNSFSSLLLCSAFGKFQFNLMFAYMCDAFASIRLNGRRPFVRTKRIAVWQYTHRHTQWIKSKHKANRLAYGKNSFLMECNSDSEINRRLIYMCTKLYFCVIICRTHADADSKWDKTSLSFSLGTKSPKHIKYRAASLCLPVYRASDKLILNWAKSERERVGMGWGQW